MKSSKLKNKVNKTESVDDLIKYKKQRILVVKVNKNCKTGFFANFIWMALRNKSMIVMIEL